LKENPAKNRTIRSYVKRDGRLTKSQLFALDNYWYKHGVESCPELINFDKLFKRRAPVVMDIGVGTGDTTISHAQSHPDNNYLAIEVHRPGVGQLLNRIELNNLTNIKVIDYDVVSVLQNQVPFHSISQIFIFFPDPWPKKRHHKRRLINSELLELIKKSLTKHGRLHIATDWEDYAEHIQQLCNSDPELINLAGNNHTVPRPGWRTKTRYETRGLRLEHNVWDFCYGLTNGHT
jgi:tRNA (guanine-N7-)-methyltransferase